MIQKDWQEKKLQANNVTALHKINKKTQNTTKKTIY